MCKTHRETLLVYITVVEKPVENVDKLFPPLVKKPYFWRFF